MAQPPSPHAITGSLSLPGNLPRSSGPNTTWPGEPTAGSDRTLYGPGIAFGAPSSGNVVLTRSALGPGPWANETHAMRTNAVVSADFMRRSLADGNTPGTHLPTRCAASLSIQTYSPISSFVSRSATLL